MYDYDEVYEKIIENTEAVNLPKEESLKIVNKIYRDLEIGLLKPRNITKRTQKLICNSFERQNKLNENLTIEHHKVNGFIEKIKPKLIISNNDLDSLKERLLDLDEINTQTLTQELNEFLKQTNNDSLKMIKNQSFRDLNHSIIGVENPNLAKKYGLEDNLVVFYCFIDHDDGLMFELLTEEGRDNYILSKNEVDCEIVEFIDKEDDWWDGFLELRNMGILDEFRDSSNPDIITVKFIEFGKSEYLKVKTEQIIGSKIIGILVENPSNIISFSKGDEVVVSYCYDYMDNIHLYVKNRDNKLANNLKQLFHEFKDPSKEVILEKLSDYKDKKEFDLIVDTFHSTIFDYFRDLSEFYREINKVGFECI